MTPRQSWPLALSYVGFFLPAGVLLSYLPPFLVSKGLEAAQVGLILSAVFAVKLVMGPVLAWWADKAQRTTMVADVRCWARAA